PPPPAEIYVLKDQLPDSLLTAKSPLIQQEVSIYPNPAKEVLHLQGGNLHAYEFRLRDMKGSILKRLTLQPPNTLLLGDMPAGMYLLEVQHLPSARKSWKRLLIME
ncbi:MAG: T9SS C-terminal target domain-containing protein, partial [Bacteroidetes bacterium]